MDRVRIFHDPEGNTLTVWFEDPGTEATCEETGDEVILMKDANGRVIGFEKLNFSQAGRRGLVVETLVDPPDVRA
jgi:uncharacterized protein YuzE